MFDGPEDYHHRIDDPALKIDEHCLLFIARNRPDRLSRRRGSREHAPPAALIKRGILSLPCIGDGRQSGTSGLAVHPQRRAGRRPSAAAPPLLRTDDIVRIDLKKRTANILISGRRTRAAPRRPQKNGGYPYPRSQTPWQEIQRSMVAQFDEGMGQNPPCSSKDVARLAGAAGQSVEPSLGERSDAATIPDEVPWWMATRNDGEETMKATFEAPSGPRRRDARAASGAARVFDGAFVHPLEPLDIKHARDLYEATHGNDRDAIWRYLFTGPYADFATPSRKWVANADRNRPILPWAVIDKATGKAVGALTLMRIEPNRHRVIEIGGITFRDAAAGHAARPKRSIFWRATYIPRSRLSPLRMEMRPFQRAVAGGATLRLRVRRPVPATYMIVRAAAATPPGGKCSIRNGRPARAAFETCSRRRISTPDGRQEISSRRSTEYGGPDIRRATTGSRLRRGRIPATARHLCTERNRARRDADPAGRRLF